MKRNIYDVIEELKREFYFIQCKNWIRSKGKGTGAAGKTFESLLGKDDDRYSLPDYNGIEIKTKFQNSKYSIELFSMAFDNKPLENQRLLKKFGYPDRKNPKFKCLNISVYGNVRTHVGFINSYQLVVDYEKEQVILEIYNYEYLVENQMSWSFKELKSRLFHKLKYLALVHVRKSILKDTEYFKYEDITFYELKDFETFLKMIERGGISVNFKLSYFKSGERLGEIHDRGSAFCIFEKDLSKLFRLIEDSYED